MLAISLAPAALAVLLLVRPPFVVDVWPFPDTSELTFLFLASILAAAGASAAWAALFGEPASYAGIALDMLVIFCPMVVYLLLLDAARGGGLTIVLVGGVAVVAAGAWMLSTSGREPFRDPRPTPRPAVLAFGIFTVALIGVGGALVLGTPYTLPWRLTPELSVICGLIFLGAAAYFAFGLWRRSWTNAGGQLAGFLAYDLVLILPFMSRVPTIPDYWRTNQILYIAVLVSSGIVAIWYLFLDPTARIGGGRRSAPVPADGHEPSGPSARG